ncbi:hypothetical protein NEUTE2DRAFT_170629 [Neurospora tetrasperma FGSC 2509]|nr:hypothetical protein NEUTE2DRAFT_170629 [Neurospora tetrasperma FGSC 2509]
MAMQRDYKRSSNSQDKSGRKRFHYLLDDLFAFQMVLAPSSTFLSLLDSF